jgi:hypothetical protein
MMIMFLILLAGSNKYYRFKSSNLDTMCPVSCGLCPSSSTRVAKRRRSKCKQQSIGSSLSMCLASTSQFFLLLTCQVIESHSIFFPRKHFFCIFILFAIKEISEYGIINDESDFSFVTILFPTYGSHLANLD